MNRTYAAVKVNSNHIYIYNHIFKVSMILYEAITDNYIIRPDSYQNAVITPIPSAPAPVEALHDSPVLPPTSRSHPPQYPHRRAPRPGRSERPW